MPRLSVDDRPVNVPAVVGHPKPGAAPHPIRPLPQPLDATTVRVLHDAVRASLRLNAGMHPDWSWAGPSEREFLRGVRGHHLSGLIAPHAAKLGMPVALREAITLDADRVALKSLAQVSLLRLIHQRLDAARIPALFVKGLAVEAQTGRQLGDRGGGDIDVWVSPEHVEAAIDALRPEWTLPNSYPQPGSSWAWRHWLRWGSELPLFGPIMVDLHWHLHCVRDTLPDFTEAWADREEVSICGLVVPTLSRAHALAHACRHADTDRWRILRSIVDIHLLLACIERMATASPPSVALRGRTIAVVDRSVGLPPGWTTRPLPSRTWVAIVDEQRYLGAHAERMAHLARSTHLRHVLGRLRASSRWPVRDALSLAWFLAVAPPHQTGRITTTSTVLGVTQGVVGRVRYELSRLGVNHSKGLTPSLPPPKGGFERGAQL